MPDSIRPDREAAEYDVVIVGGGPSGLACAIRLMQLGREREQEISVCLLEKGAEIGAHLLSGAVLEPRALNELIPDWQDKGAPLNTPAKKDKFYFLTEKKAYPFPNPPQMHNKGNYIISLGNLARWMAEQAESMGVEIYPGFPASEMLFNDQGHVIGVATGDMGLDENGEKTDAYEPGLEIHAKQTILAEGCRGHLTKGLFEKFDMRKNCDPQTYGIGIKELWEINPEKHEPGLVMHTIGWPMDRETYGGSWMYHFEDNLVSVGFVIGLDYKNPHLSPFDEMQRFKLHPHFRHYFEDGRRVSYGARALTEGGYQSIPELTFPGGILIGDTAGFLNVPKIKGNHTAMKSGMVAAESVFDMLKDGQADQSEAQCNAYPEALKKSWLWKELHKIRNIRPGFQKGMWPGLVNAAIETYTLGKLPRTLHHRHADHETLRRADESLKIKYPKPDGKITFDKLSSVYISNTNHRENQPVHLVLKDPSIPVDHNLPLYDEPAQRYCPAAVYEIVEDDHGQPYMQINGQNCVHCKTCDIKDPKQNIDWIAPEGGGGPNYPNM